MSLFYVFFKNKYTTGQALVGLALVLGLAVVLGAVTLDLVTEEVACAVELGGPQAAGWLAHVHHGAIVPYIQN